MFFLIEIEEEEKQDILACPIGHTIVFENTIIIIIRYVFQKEQ